MYTPNKKEIKSVEYSELKLILNDSLNPLRDLVAFEAKDLKDLLVKDGYIKDPIELHGSIILGYKILDGFHRFSLVDEILKENIPFNTNIPCIFHSLLSPQEVFLFAVSKQVARRNLTPPERAELVRQARDLGVSKEEIKNTFGIKDRTFYRDLNPTSAENNRQSTAKNYYTHPQSNSLNRACQDDTFITAIVPNAESNTTTVFDPVVVKEAVNLSNDIENSKTTIDKEIKRLKKEEKQKTKEYNKLTKPTNEDEECEEYLENLDEIRELVESKDYPLAYTLLRELVEIWQDRNRINNYN